MVGEGNFRNILCGVDLSADAPVVEAHRLAGGSDAGPPLTFLHVLPGDFPGAPMSPDGAAQAVIFLGLTLLLIGATALLGRRKGDKP